MGTEDELILRLRTEADTAALKRAVKDLEGFQAEARKMGMSEQAVSQAVKQRYDQDVALARQHKTTYREYINNLSEYAALNRKAGNEAETAGRRAESAHRRVASAIGAHASGLAGLASRYIGVAAAGEALRRSFMASADIDLMLRRVANQAGVSNEAIRALVPQWKALSRQTGQSLEELVRGFDVFRDSLGMAPEEAQKVFPAIARGALAAGISVEEMSSSMATAMINMGIKGRDVTKVMDMMVMAGEDMQMNLSSLTQAMPRLSEAMANWGMKGTSGMAAMLAHLHSLKGDMSNIYPTTQAAAEGLGRFMEMMTETKTVQGLVSTGVVRDQDHLIKLLRTAQSQGKDVLSFFIDMVKEAEKRGANIEQMFGARYRQVFRALARDPQKVREEYQALEGAAGRAAKSAQNVIGSHRKTINDLLNEIHELTIAFGDFLANNGMTEAVTDITSSLQSLQEFLAEFDTVVQNHHIDWERLFDISGMKTRWNIFLTTWKLHASQWGDLISGGGTSGKTTRLQHQLGELNLAAGVKPGHMTTKDINDRIRGPERLEGNVLSNIWKSLTERRELTDEERKAKENLGKLNETTKDLDATLKKMSWTLEGSASGSGGARVMKASLGPGGGGGGGARVWGGPGGGGYHPGGAGDSYGQGGTGPSGGIRGPHNWSPGGNAALADETGRPIDKDTMGQIEAMGRKGDVDGIARLTAQRGYRMSGPACGIIASRYARAAGFKPPPGGAMASNWSNWGESMPASGINDPSHPAGSMFGTYNHARYGPNMGQRLSPGQKGGHVMTAIPGTYDPKTNTAQFLDQHGVTRRNLNDINLRYAGDAAVAQQQARAGGQAAPAGSRSDGAAPEGASNEYLAKQRAWIGEEMKNNPRVRSLLGATAHLEDDAHPGPVIESAMNRVNLMRDKGMKNVSLERHLRSRFFGRRTRANMDSVANQLENNPRWKSRFDTEIDRALGGSDRIEMNTDQGGPGDPNYGVGGNVKYFGREAYGDWGGVAGSGRWREEQRRRVLASGPAKSREETKPGDDWGHDAKPHPFMGENEAINDHGGGRGANVRDALNAHRRMRREMERPIKIKYDHPGEGQFRRASMRREANREVREARHKSHMDIGAA